MFFNRYHLLPLSLSDCEAYPDVSEMQATTICTVDTCGLSDVRCNCDQEGKDDILEDEYPSSAIPRKASAARTVF